MKSQELFLNILASGAGRGFTSLGQILASAEMAGPLEELFSQAEIDIAQLSNAWTPGQEVNSHTLVSGAIFRDFFENGWNPDWYHDDAEIQVEGENGEWLLEDEKIYPLSKLGYSCWQGKEGQPHSSGKMFPVFMQFGTWAAKNEPSCEVTPSTP